VEALSSELDRIVFIEGLGSIGQKWRRVLEVAREINARLPLSARVDDDALARAARLCKADLASTMIRDGKEFTSLQGVIGAQYALACGEDEGVAAAIREHYAPRAATDALPASALARVIGLADRVDSITGCFLAGLKPSGSQDPYALRRGANGVVRLAVELPGVRLDEVLEAAKASYASVLERGDLDDRWTKKRAGADLADFMRGRVEAFLKDQGLAYDVVDAVVPVAWVEPGVAAARAREIAALRGDRTFERLITGVKRVGNILAKDRRRLGASWDEVRAGLAGPGEAFSTDRFQDPAETRLLEALRKGLGQIDELESRTSFTGVLRVLASLADPIDGYFDRVLVNSDDAAVRENRHAFLAAAYALFGRYADFQRIVEEGSPGG
jgi:glycyl-tRNA synthetase beta chain